MRAPKKWEKVVFPRVEVLIGSEVTREKAQSLATPPPSRSSSSTPEPREESGKQRRSFTKSSGNGIKTKIEVSEQDPEPPVAFESSKHFEFSVENRKNTKKFEPSLLDSLDFSFPKSRFEKSRCPSLVSPQSVPALLSSCDLWHADSTLTTGEGGGFFLNLLLHLSGLPPLEAANTLKKVETKKFSFAPPRGGWGNVLGNRSLILSMREEGEGGGRGDRKTPLSQETCGNMDPKQSTPVPVSEKLPPSSCSIPGRNDKQMEKSKLLQADVPSRSKLRKSLTIVPDMFSKETGWKVGKGEEKEEEERGREDDREDKSKAKVSELKVGCEENAERWVMSMVLAEAKNRAQEQAKASIPHEMPRDKVAMPFKLYKQLRKQKQLPSSSPPPSPQPKPSTFHQEKIHSFPPSNSLRESLNIRVEFGK